MSKPVVYLFLGCKGSDQFRVLADLIEFGTEKEERSVLYHFAGDAVDVESDFQVKHRETKVATWKIEDGALDIEIDESLDLVFLVADGLSDPTDLVEAFHGWLPESGCELGRVVTVLNCDLAVRQKVAFEWFECCIHFSDIVLLARREKVANKEMKAFLDRFEEECYPCLWEYVKKGRVSNPSLVLDTQPRRITRIFDEPEYFDDEEEEEELEEDIAGDVTKDRFLKRASGGRRALELPDISEFL
ncbi:hypothetical protein [Pelagicoccus mobilis]|uniref:CobW/HypB/UreG nucleotide-binding domain-containing protein n=1 Tax=Pelagicoccus mobilis TaxID=415221 RepID=A0A934S4C3_9BACT|nr:hypothetical protein [Pelagicoccus mobilis]MBK1880501.1 hypothetical protein [Pelagicoccus mobilis]